MARQKKPDRFVCIEDRKRGELRYRVHAVKGGRRRVECFRTRDEAAARQAQIERATAHLHGSTVEVALEQYIAEMTAEPNPKWRRTSKQYASKVGVLRRFFAPVSDVAIGALTEAHVTRCCRAWDTEERPAASTRDNARRRAAAFCSWAIGARLLRTMPMTSAHVVAMSGAPLPSLRLDDARRLRAVVDPAAAQGDESAVFVLAALLLGARTSELTSLTALNLDDGGRVLAFPDAKEPTHVHRVRLPGVLVAPMRLLAERAGEGLLMRPRGRGPKAWGASAVRHWASVAGIAGAGEMDARWLRRTKDTLAVEAGVSSEVVARETGHTLHVARQHYIQRGAETTGRAAAMEEATGTDSIRNSTKAANDS